MKKNSQRFDTNNTEMKNRIYPINLKSLKLLVRVVLAILFTGTGIALNAQISCDVTMACNDTIQVSFDPTCDVTITPSMMLEGQNYDDSFHSVDITEQAGNMLP